MRLTLGQINTALPTLDRLANKEMSVKTAFRVARIIKELKSIVVDIETQRISLVRKYGKSTKPAQSGEVSEGLRVTEENQEKFYKEFAEFLKEEVDLSLTEKDLIQLDDLEVDLTPVEVISIEPFIKMG